MDEGGQAAWTTLPPTPEYGEMGTAVTADVPHSQTADSAEAWANDHDGADVGGTDPSFDQAPDDSAYAGVSTQYEGGTGVPHPFMQLYDESSGA